MSVAHTAFPLWVRTLRGCCNAAHEETRFFLLLFVFAVSHHRQKKSTFLCYCSSPSPKRRVSKNAQRAAGTPTRRRRKESNPRSTERPFLKMLIIAVQATGTTGLCRPRITYRGREHGLNFASSHSSPNDPAVDVDDMAATMTSIKRSVVFWETMTVCRWFEALQFDPQARRTFFGCVYDHSNERTTPHKKITFLVYEHGMAKKMKLSCTMAP